MNVARNYLDQLFDLGLRRYEICDLFRMAHEAKSIYFLFVFALCCNVKATDVWQRLPVSGDAELWFLGFEENEFIRSRIGDWLAIRMFKSDGAELLWRFEELKRVDNKTSFTLRIRNRGGREYGVGTSPFVDKGPSGQPEAVVYQEGSDFYVSLKMGDGTARRIMFRRGRDIDGGLPNQVQCGLVEV